MFKKEIAPFFNVEEENVKMKIFFNSDKIRIGTRITTKEKGLVTLHIHFEPGYPLSQIKDDLWF